MVRTLGRRGSDGMSRSAPLSRLSPIYRLCRRGSKLGASAADKSTATHPTRARMSQTFEPAARYPLLSCSLALLFVHRAKHISPRSPSSCVPTTHPAAPQAPSRHFDTQAFSPTLFFFFPSCFSVLVWLAILPYHYLLLFGLFHFDSFSKPLGDLTKAATNLSHDDRASTSSLVLHDTWKTYIGFVGQNLDLTSTLCTGILACVTLSSPQCRVACGVCGVDHTQSGHGHRERI